MKNKILLVNNGFPSEIHPQYSTYIKSIYECMLRAGLDVELLTLDTIFTSKIGKIYQYIKYYLKLWKIDPSNYSVVYIHNYPHSFLPLILKLRKLKKVFIHWHGTDIFAPTWLGEILNKLSYMFIPKEAKHMTPSRYFAKIVSRQFDISMADILVSPSGGVDTDLFSPVEKQVDDSIVLGFASSMRKDKGIDFVLDLMKKTDYIKNITGIKIKLLCINYGADKDYYSSELLKLSNVEILDPIPKSEMVTFYHKIDILLLSSRMAESLALVGLEAMSCNVPVVGTNDFAIKDYVLDGIGGEKFLKGDSISFLDAVVRVIKNLKRYQPREIVLTKYSKKFVVGQYSNYFGE